VTAPATFRVSTLKPSVFGSENELRFGSETPSTFRGRLDRDTAATTAAPASPASAAPPATSGIFAFSTTSPTLPAAFCTALLAVPFAPVSVPFAPAFRALPDVLRGDAEVLERERLLAVRVERLESAPFLELVPARVDLLFDDPFRDALLLRLRVPEDFEDEFRALLVLVCAMALSLY
jgi:hypothetical protein